MRQYRLTVFEEPRSVSFDFEAESDCDAVRLGEAAAAGEGGALWREGRLLLRLEKLGVEALGCTPWGPGFA
jgi:hypothetical protein